MSLWDRFSNPPAEFRQAPFWFWNHRLDKGLLSQQIDQMEDKGLGGFVMHARHGLLTPYLSDEWFDCVRHCCQEAKERGLIAWAYDERDWPSGPAGGTVIQDPAKRLTYVRMAEEAVEGPCEVTFGEDVVAAYLARACPRPGCDCPPLERLWTPQVTLESGSHRLIKILRFACPAILWFDSYLDTLNPEACQAFVESTYDRHEQKLGNLSELGLAGFFTDEPALSTYPDDLGRIPWTPKLPDVFQELKGYDLLDHLPALFAAGDAGARVRYDYWDVVTGLFERSFFTALGGWCEQRGLQLIGHPLGEEPLFYQFRCLGSIFKYLKHLHMPGMDHLTITVGKNNPIAMNPKLISSAALLAGRKRTMTETFGESGWGLSLREMKWMADWQIVNGINYFVPHAFYYSIAGRRKKDSPPSEFFQAPHWPHYRLFADYTARVTAVMTGGEHVAKVALLYPMASVWADFVPGGEIPTAVAEIEAAFAPLGETLLQLHRDFVIVDEESLACADVEDDSFAIRGLCFEALVIPPLTTLRRETLEAIRRIAEKRVVIAVGTERIRVLHGDISDPVRLDDLAGLVRVARGSGKELEKALATVSQDVRIDNAPDVYYLHRRREGRDLYFFANTGQEPVDTRTSLERVGQASVWDPETGQSAPVPGQREHEGRLDLPLRLGPMASLLLEVNPGAPPSEVQECFFVPHERLNLCDDLWHFTPFDGNFLTLRQWRMSTDTKHKVTELRYTTEFILTEHIANLRLILDGVPEHPYSVPQAARPIVADETYSRILLDGDPLTAEQHWEIDPHFRVLDLQGCCEPGAHRLDIVIRNHGWFPQPGLEEYAWLAGDFMLDLTEAVPRLAPVRGVRTGPWEEQGFPYFSGTAAYAADIDIPADLSGQRVFLDAGRVGDLLEIEVNGRSAGVRAWPPYRTEITHLVWPGQSNLIVLKVTNTLRNFLEGPDKDRPSGLLEEVWIEIG